MNVIWHASNAVEFSLMAHDIAMNIGIQLTFIPLINSRDAAMGAEYYMIYKMGIAHNGTKIGIINRFYNSLQTMGSPSATR